MNAPRGISSIPSHERWFLRLLLLAPCLAIAALHPTQAAEAGRASALPSLPGASDANLLESFGINLLKVQTEPDLVEALRLATSGQLDAALASAEDYIKLKPDSAAAEEVLGMILVQQGKTAEGMSHLQRAIEINPKQSSAITKIGDIYLAQGDKARARSQFQQAISINPNDRHPHQRLGLLYEEEAELPLAIDHFEQGLQGTPASYVGIKVNLGRLYNRVGLPRKTVRLLAPVVRDDLPNPTAHLVLGTAWLMLRDPQQALASFERAKRFEMNPEASHLAFGIAYREAGDTAKSTAELEEALKLKPQWSAAEVQLAETFAAAGRLADATALLDGVGSRDPSLRTALKNRAADLHAKAGDHDGAIRVFEALRAEGSADVRTYLGLTTALQLKNRLDEAESVLAEADSKFPANTHIRFRMGMHRALVRDYDGALEILRAARELAPADPRLQKAISLAEQRRGNTKAAIEEARRLLQLVPHSHEDGFYLATLFEEAGQDASAEKLYEAVLHHSGEHVGALNNLAMIRLRNHQYDDALELASKAAGLAPENPAVLDTLGLIQFRSGKLAEAADTLRKCVAEAAANPTYRYHLALAYSELGEPAKAIEQLELALEQKSEFPERSSATALAAKLRAQ